MNCRSLSKPTLILILATMAFAACGKKSSSKSASTPNATANPDAYCHENADQYDGSDFDPERALNGCGRWIDVGGQRYFVPDRSYLADGDEWAPYQNGYWSYDEQFGFTWVSYDRWGWMTEHYGIWRHHRTYGWCWMPFPDGRYQPHVVTWFDDDDYVGWYPYHSEYSRYYVQHRDFDDGLWNGFRAAVSFRGDDFAFRLGITLVRRGDLHGGNIRTRVIRDRRVWRAALTRSHTNERIRLGYVGRRPRVERDQWNVFVNLFPRGRAQQVRSRGGAIIVQPERHRETPRDQRERWQRVDRRRDRDRVRDRGFQPQVLEDEDRSPRRPDRDGRRRGRD